MSATNVTEPVDYSPECVPARPVYRSKALRRMSAEDRLYAAMANWEATGRSKWSRRADSAASVLAYR